MPNDIEVHADPVGPFDVQSVDVAVIVEANDYPQRRAKLESVKNRLCADIGRVLMGPNGVFTSSVWVRLAPGAFGEAK
jgi:hypothetical protein